MYVARTNSTNTLLKELLARGEWPNDEKFIYAGYQTAGRGQTGNGWESEEGKNLLCSIPLPPAKNIYFLNIAVSVAIIRLLNEQLTIKWPNDIYWRDKKLAGILLENAIIGSEVMYVIAGIGLNVNQEEFVSDAPNPVSLKQITGKEYDLDQLMKDLYKTVNTVLNESEDVIWSEYKSHLYRRDGFWPFEDINGGFEARIVDVLPSGEIVLENQQGTKRIYHFKQVRYVI